MKFLIFDTETTGLPKTKLLQELELWPHIVQLSYLVFDTDLNNIIIQKDWIIKISNDIIIDEEVSKIHGITNEISSKKGIDLKKCFRQFLNDIEKVDMVIGHNINFDINIVKVELLRIIGSMRISQKIKMNYKKYLYSITNYKNYYCTMQESIELCSIEKTTTFGKKYLKYPKLSELHEKLFNCTPNHLHNSYNDVLITLRCFIKLKYNTDIYIDCNQFKIITENINLLPSNIKIN